MNIITAAIVFSLFAFSNNSNIASNAESWEGKYYKQGQTARCADFVGSVVSKSGKKPPEGYAKCTSWLSWGQKVSVENIQKGDIVIYAASGGFNHIGIYVGNGEIIHRPTSSRRVSRLNYKYNKIIGVRRP